MNTTNIHILLKPQCDDAILEENFVRHESFQLPMSNCRTTVFNLINLNKTDLNCCRDLTIFRDLSNLQISTDELVSMDSSARKENIENGCENIVSDAEDCAYDIWYESEVFINGFKEILVKGKSIWT